MFTDAYEGDRCALAEGAEDECEQQSSKAEQGENYLQGQPRFTDSQGRLVGTCELNKQLVDGEANVKLTHFDNGYIRCKVDSNYVGNVNVTFATTFNGQSSSQKSLYAIGGQDFELFNFQLIPGVDNIDKHVGSTAGGNILTVSGGPFLEEETKVNIGGAEAKILSLTKDQMVI